MIVLDTNVISEAMKPQPAPKVVGWLNRQSAETVFLCSVTVAELLYGLAVLPDSARKSRLNRTLDGLRALFADRVLPFDEPAARRYAGMAAAARAVGRPLPLADGYIASIAAAHKFAVATRNTQDFQDTGVRLINPWQD